MLPSVLSQTARKKFAIISNSGIADLCPFSGLVFQGNAGFFPCGLMISVDLCYHDMFAHARDMEV